MSSLGDATNDSPANQHRLDIRIKEAARTELGALAVAAEVHLQQPGRR